MKKKVVKLSIGIIVIFIISIIGLFYNANNKTTITKDGITYALTLDGENASTFPSKGMYRADVVCEGATGKWLYDDWKLAIEDITSDNITCDIDFTTISQTNLNSYIIGLSGQIQGTGEVVNENGYRYEGKDPNNYIWFNNELWRVIGVFNEDSHGVSGQNLVKIIRVNSIGGLVWDKSNVNDWSQASLMNLLNGAFLNSENGTGGEYCYSYSASSPSNCNYTESGINDIYKSMIENVTWYLGGYSSNNATTEAFYEYERGDTVYSGRPTSMTAYIGLMYPSDYGYSVLSSSCARTTNLGSYNNAECAGQSWLFGQGYEWTITPASSYNFIAFYVSDSGYLNDTGPLSNYYISGYGREARPVLYLDSNVYVIDGNGSISDPYIIGM